MSLRGRPATGTPQQPPHLASMYAYIVSPPMQSHKTLTHMRKHKAGSHICMRGQPSAEAPPDPQQQPLPASTTRSRGRELSRTVECACAEVHAECACVVAFMYMMRLCVTQSGLTCKHARAACNGYTASTAAVPSAGESDHDPKPMQGV